VALFYLDVCRGQRFNAWIQKNARVLLGGLLTVLISFWLFLTIVPMSWLGCSWGNTA